MDEPILIGTSRDHYGCHYVTFSITGKRYTYQVEHSDVPTIRSIIKYSRWKALHYTRKMAKTFSS